MAVNSFISLAQSLSPALFRLPLLGDLRSLDSYNRATTIVSAAGGPVWRRDKKGSWFGNRTSLTDSGALSIADAAELRATSGTVFWTARNFQTLAADYSSRIVSRRDAGGGFFDLYIDNANQLGIYDGTNTRTFASAALSGSHTGAIRYVNGAIPQLFVDGAYRVDGSGTISPTTAAVTLYLANYYASFRSSKHNDYGCFLIFNDAILGRAITDLEISQLHDAWESIVSIHAPKRTISLPRKATEIVASTPLSHLAGAKTPGNLWLDSSGNGRDLTITGRVTQTHATQGHFLSGHGAGDPLLQSAISFGYDANNWTLEFDFMARSTGGGGQGCLFALTDGGVIRALLSFAAANTFSYSITHATTNGTWTFSSGPYNQWHHLSIRHERSTTDPPVVELDGELLAEVETSTPVGATVALAAPRVNLLNTAAVDADFDGAIRDFKFYDSVLGYPETHANYVQFALSDVRRLANRTDYPVSVADVAAGYDAGPYKVLGGTHRWNDDGARRRLLGVTQGQMVSRQHSQSHGLWYARFQRPAAGISLMPLVASVPTLLTDAAQNGWVLGASGAGALYIRKYTGGANAQIAVSADGVVLASTPYEAVVTRRKRDGCFVAWLRGGAYATWTSILTGTDAAHATSACLVGFVDAAGFIADETYIPGGDTLVPTDIPWLQ